MEKTGLSHRPKRKPKGITRADREARKSDIIDNITNTTMKLTKDEQETIVNYNGGEQVAIVYTADKAVMKRLDNLVAAYPEVYQLMG